MSKKPYELDYLKLLFNDYLYIQSVCTEIINLQAIFEFAQRNGAFYE